MDILSQKRRVYFVASIYFWCTILLLNCLCYNLTIKLHWTHKIPFRLDGIQWTSSVWERNSNCLGIARSSTKLIWARIVLFSFVYKLHLQKNVQFIVISSAVRVRIAFLVVNFSLLYQNYAWLSSIWSLITTKTFVRYCVKTEDMCCQMILLSAVVKLHFINVVLIWKVNVGKNLFSKYFIV